MLVLFIIFTYTRYNKSDVPSRLKILFLLDSGASISLLIYPTYIALAKRPNITNNNTTPNTSKTLTVANQTEVPVLLYVTLTLNTTIGENFRQFITPFAVADIKYNIHATPFCEEYIQNINIQDFTLQFRHHSKEFPNHTKLTSLLSKESIILSSHTSIELTLKHNFA